MIDAKYQRQLRERAIKMNKNSRQARAKKKAKQNRVMRNPLGADPQEVIALLKKTLRRRPDLTNAKT
jgi:hypothetical protein